jgi:hypothetical protein
MLGTVYTQLFVPYTSDVVLLACTTTRYLFRASRVQSDTARKGETTEKKRNPRQRVDDETRRRSPVLLNVIPLSVVRRQQAVAPALHLLVRHAFSPAKVQGTSKALPRPSRPSPLDDWLRGKAMRKDIKHIAALLLPSVLLERRI